MAVKRATMTEILSAITLTKKKIDFYTKSSDYTTNPMSVFIGLKKNGEEKINGKTSAEISDTIMGNYQAYTQHLKNYSKLLLIKNAVNTTTYVTIAGATMTIAEALAYNTKPIKEHCKVMIDRLNEDWAKAQRTIAEYNQQKFSDEKINAYLQTALGGVSSDEMGRIKKSDPARITELTNTYTDINRMELIDPLDILKKIDTWTNWYNEFFTTINFRLSEINSRLIVEYDLDKDVNFFRIVNQDEVGVQVQR